MYAPITNFVRIFFLSFESVKALIVWSLLLDTASWAMANKLHTTWPPRMRIVPPFGLRNTVENFTKFSNLVQTCRFAPQASIYSHVSKSSSKKECMNLSLNSAFSKNTGNSNFPTPLELCRFSTTSAIHLFKNSEWLSSRTGKKLFQVSRVLGPQIGLE